MGKRLVALMAVATFVTLATGDIAFASHARPKAATPKRDPLVPAYRQCDNTYPNGIDGQHNGPLASPSCTNDTQGPIQRSSYLTMNAPDRRAPYNTAPDFAGYVSQKVTCLSSVGPPVQNGDVPDCHANPGDQQDVILTVSITAARCFGTSGGCSSAGARYNGMVKALQRDGHAVHEAQDHRPLELAGELRSSV